MVKIELVDTQSNRLIKTAACSVAKNRAGVMKIELPHTQNDRLVMTADCSAKGKTDMLKIGPTDTRDKRLIVIDCPANSGSGERINMEM